MEVAAAALVETDAPLSTSASSSTQGVEIITTATTTTTRERDSVVLVANENVYSFAQLNRGKSLRLVKKQCLLDGLIGHPFGSCFEVLLSIESLEDPTNTHDHSRKAVLIPKGDEGK